MTPRTLRTVFAVPRMDCPSEERLIRMALDGAQDVGDLQFDLQARTLTVVHAGEPDSILVRLEPLGLGARLAKSEEATSTNVASSGSDAAEARTLRLALAINLAMFVVELAAGLLAQSTGLIADSLDMLADATVYGLSLYAVGRALRTKLRAARVAGLLQGILAVGVLADVARRLATGSAPEAPAMIGVSLIALAANATCLVLLASHRRGGAHMRASWIFTSTDVLANVGVIVAGALVAWTGSRIPDLIVGTAVGLIVLGGSVKILRLR
jgi:Co/Zn/Cd efflux system component